MNRRGFLGGMAGILAGGFAPAAIGSGVLMPVRKIAEPVYNDITITLVQLTRQKCEAAEARVRKIILDMEIGQIDRFTIYETPLLRTNFTPRRTNFTGYSYHRRVTP